MDLEREEVRRQYRLCRIGFAFVALGVGLLCLSDACFSAFLLTGKWQILELLRTSWWDWLVGSPITWCTVVGSYFLWARAADPSWQRRAGALLVMNLIDLILWTISHEEPLGLRLGDLGNPWFRQALASGMGWVEFMLFASLAAELSAHLGKAEAPQAHLAARSVATIGLVFWLLSFLSQTDWKGGWPLVQQPPKPPGLEPLLFLLGASVLTAITSFQVAALCLGASRQCARVLAEMDEQDGAHDLLSSRSESGDDDPRHWYDDDDPWR
jgi:hypothetical protein